MKDLTRFMVDGRPVTARLLAGRILVDPVLPRNFDNTANDCRPRSRDFSAMTFADSMAALGTAAPFTAHSRRSNLPWMRR